MEIRLSNTQDYESMLDVYTPFVTETAITFDYEIPTLTQFTKKLDDIRQGYPCLVLAIDNVVKGYAYAGTFRSKAAYQWSCESTIYLASEAQGKGLGKRLYGTLLELLKLQGFHNVFGGVTLPNDASVNLHLTLGYFDIGLQEKVGFKHGKWHTTRWFQKHLRDFDSEPKSILTISELKKSPKFDSILSRVNDRLGA